MKLNKLKREIVSCRDEQNILILRANCIEKSNYAIIEELFMDNLHKM